MFDALSHNPDPKTKDDTMRWAQEIIERERQRCPDWVVPEWAMPKQEIQEDKGMMVFAIDPGPTQSAWVIWNGAKILAKNISPNDSLLQICRNGLSTHIMAIEQIMSYGMTVSTSIFDTVFWTGRFCQAWEQARGKWERVPRMAVKMHLCHNSRAKDGNIRQALIDRFGEPGTKKHPGSTYGLRADQWQAFALAVFYCDTQGCKV